MIVETDVIVIGAGMAGAGVAGELSRDRRVVLLEQEAHPGLHATGRSGALFLECYGNDCVRRLTRASHAFFVQERRDFLFASPRTTLFIATIAQLDDLHRLAGEPGIAGSAELVSGREAEALVPALKRDVVVAALAERKSLDLDVAAIQLFYIRQLREHGGSLHCSARVTACDRKGGEWHVTAGETRFRAPVVVNAAGPWGDAVAAMAGVDRIGLVPRRRTALVTDAPQGMDPAAWAAVIDVSEQFYFKPDAGRVMMSPADETAMEPCDAWAEEMDIAIAVDRVQQVADIPVRRISHSWAGLRTFAPDRTPVAGFDVRAEGFFWLVGQGGYGIQTAPALSRLAAGLIVDGAIPADLADMGLAESDLGPARLDSVGPLDPASPEKAMGGLNVALDQGGGFAENAFVAEGEPR